MKFNYMIPFIDVAGNYQRFESIVITELKFFEERTQHGLGIMKEKYSSASVAVIRTLIARRCFTLEELGFTNFDDLIGDLDKLLKELFNIRRFSYNGMDGPLSVLLDSHYESFAYSLFFTLMKKGMEHLDVEYNDPEKYVPIRISTDFGSTETRVQRNQGEKGCEIAARGYYLELVANGKIHNGDTLKYRVEYINPKDAPYHFEKVISKTY